MDSDDFVSIKEISQQLGMDRSNTRKYVLKLGYEFHRRRTADSANQLTLCLTRDEASEVLSRRSEQGFISPTVVIASEVGVFYVIQLVPDLDPGRVKLGFAESLEQRLAQHRTAAPTARVLKAWPCKRSWELTVIDALTTINCKLILNEVFECDDLNALVERGNQLFSLLPNPAMRRPLSDKSPLALVRNANNEV
jgi:hypothetical protein